MHTHAGWCGNATHGQRPTAFVHLHGVRNAEWVSQRGRERVSLHLVSISVCVCVRCSLTIKLGTGFICDSYHSLCTYRERTAIELVERRGRGGEGEGLACKNW